MAKAGRGQTRRDSKRRVLRPGESIRADGKYQYKYHIDGKPHFVYSWKLEPTYNLPKGKKPCLSLRELEKQVNTDLDLLVNIVDGQMTVCELVDRYLKTKTGVRQSTKQKKIYDHMRILNLKIILFSQKQRVLLCQADQRIRNTPGIKTFW